MGAVMLINAMLKQFFQVPLLPTVGHPGFAFPSGHMIAALAFYGYLFLDIDVKWVRALLLVLLVGIGVSLVGRGYHTWFDVLGAWGFGLCFLYVYHLAQRYGKALQLPWGLIMGGVYLLLFLAVWCYLPVFPKWLYFTAGLLLAMVLPGSACVAEESLSKTMRCIGGVAALVGGGLIFYCIEVKLPWEHMLRAFFIASWTFFWVHGLCRRILK